MQEGKPSDAELRDRLSPTAYEVTQHEATEPPFQNRYWDNHEPGLYVDVVSGEPLFGSYAKFDSGTGWPSFTQPLTSDAVVTRTDTSHGTRRTEVRSHHADSHLGHVFDDGPAPSGLRYCINSAALRFIPLARLEQEGYGEFQALFTSSASGADVADTKRATSNACVSAGPGQVAGCSPTLEVAVLAGGCFWGMQDILRKIPGVVETEVGYAGGTTEHPTYEQVSTGRTGHAEAVRVVFDPARLSYQDLLEHWFFRMHDPTTKNRQGHDEGTQYRSAIFATSEAQRLTAETVKRRVAQSGRWSAPLQTEIVDAGKFTPAESYHQGYLQKHPGGYSCHYVRD